MLGIRNLHGNRLERRSESRSGGLNSFMSKPGRK
jgi:gelsolin